MGNDRAYDTTISCVACREGHHGCSFRRLEWGVAKAPSIFESALGLEIRKRRSDRSPRSREPGTSKKGKTRASGFERQGGELFSPVDTQISVVDPTSSASQPPPSSFTPSFLSSPASAAAGPSSSLICSPSVCYADLSSVEQALENPDLPPALIEGQILALACLLTTEKAEAEKITATVALRAKHIKYLQGRFEQKLQEQGGVNVNRPDPQEG